jgi:hypothetical protein
LLAPDAAFGWPPLHAAEPSYFEKWKFTARRFLD